MSDYATRKIRIFLFFDIKICFIRDIFEKNEVLFKNNMQNYDGKLFIDGQCEIYNSNAIQNS